MILLSFNLQTCLLSSVLFLLLLYLNVDLCPLKRSLNSFFVKPIFVFADPSSVLVAWYITANLLSNSFIFIFIKYNRGRRPDEEVWAFGIVTTGFRPKKGFYQVVRKRDRRILLPIIQHCLLPGTEVHTDDWGAYRNLVDHAANVGIHKVVVHADNFVDQATGVHTQDIESRWSDLKLEIKTRKGVRQTDMQAFLEFRMWC